MLFQDVRSFACHDIPQYAAADAGDHTEKNNQEMIFPITGIHAGINSDNRERPKADGVQAEGDAKL